MAGLAYCPAMRPSRENAPAGASPFPTSWFRVNPVPKVKVAWNQWLVGVHLDYGHIIPTRWLVVHLGPLSLAFDCGRAERVPGWARD